MRRDQPVDQPLRVGVAGLGDAGSQVVEAIPEVPGFVFAAVADTRKEVVDAHRNKYGVHGFDSVAAMAESPDVDVVYVATPNKYHVEHTLAAAENHRHVIVVKPMALTLEECDRMIAAADKNRVKLVYGHSRIYDPPVRQIAEIVRSGELGRVIQINTWMYGGWLQRKPRLASELDTTTGGGVVYRQAPHQADIVRWIGGGLAKSVRAITGKWDPNFNTEGNYSAFLEFEDGTVATMVMNGYGYFGTSEFTHGTQMKSGQPRITGASDPALKYSGAGRQDYYFASAERSRQPFYGFTVVSCERGDIRQSLEGLYVYTADGRKEVPCPPVTGKGRSSVKGALTALYEAVTQKRGTYPGGHWANATLEVCLAILQSNQERREISLSHQVPSPY